MLSAALDWIYPAKCGSCGLFGEGALCGDCRSEMIPYGLELEMTTEPLDYVGALFYYHGRAGMVLRQLKTGRRTSLAAPLAEMLFQGLEARGLGDVDLVVPVPLHWTRRAWRGFNQSELLAAKLPRVAASLVKTRRTRPQVSLAARERGTNLEGAFRATPLARGKHVLLVDDIVTTTSTARACAEALKAAGAAQVGLLAVARGGGPEPIWPAWPDDL